jgi:predicted Na+-dependent transporter
VPRFIPPHLMALVVLLIIVIWFMLVHRFRRSTMLQRFIAEVFGDDTPENALLAFDVAKQRMALGLPLNREVIDCASANRAY